jgi:hypothetical protein
MVFGIVFNSYKYKGGLNLKYIALYSNGKNRMLDNFDSLKSFQPILDDICEEKEFTSVSVWEVWEGPDNRNRDHEPVGIISNDGSGPVYFKGDMYMPKRTLGVTKGGRGK